MNMSYCRFQNTANDLSDCVDALNENDINEENEHGEKLSEKEFRSAKRLIELAREIADLYEDVDLDEITL